MKNMKAQFSIFKISILLALIFCCISEQTANAQNRTGASFLKILPGARLQGFSGNATALIDETYALYANPAAIGLFREHQWSMTYTKWITDIYNISLTYGRPIKTPWSKRTGIALGINYQGVKEFDSSRGATPPASASDILLTAGFGNPVSFISKNLSIGTNLKYFRSELDQYSAYSVMMDYGALYRTDRFKFFGGDGEGLFKYGIFSVGAAVTHIGLRLKHINEWTPLPRTYRVGAAFYTGSHSGLQLQIAADYRDVADETSTFGFGSELSWRQRISIRGGYNFNDRFLSKYSLGFGIRLDDVQSALNTKITGRNNALGFDLVALENNDFFSDAYRGSITHIPLGPEKFQFVSENNLEYTNKETIQLAWEDTRDPDLYDDIYWGYTVSKDSLNLNNFITKTENWEIDFSDGLNEAIAFDITEQTISKDKDLDLLTTEIQPLLAGDYYWTTWAFDKDRHVRFAKSNNQKIRHFKVIEEPIPVVIVPPDTAADITLTKTLLADPVRLDIHFAFDIDTLDYHSREQLNMLGIALNSSEFLNLNVELGGHTDERGEVPYNQALSQRRVNSAKNFLVEETGIFERRVSAVGYGESTPVYPNTKDKAEHAVNRRVELKFIEPSNMSSAPQVILYKQNFTYELKIENRSNNSARNIKLIDILPDTIHATNFSRQPTIDGKNLIWSIPSIGPRESIVISYSANAPSFVTSNPHKLENIANVSAMNDTVLTNNHGSSIIYVIGSPDTLIYLDSNEIELSTSEKEALTTWANYLKAAPYIDVCIECHTDNFASAQENLLFSEQKAETARNFVATWLVENAYVDETKLNINAKGWGSEQPNKTSSKNQRLVFHLSPCK